MGLYSIGLVSSIQLILFRAAPCLFIEDYPRAEYDRFGLQFEGLIFSRTECYVLPERKSELSVKNHLLVAPGLRNESQLIGRHLE